MAKSSESKNVISVIERRNPDLRGYLYKPLDRRKQGDERVLRGLRDRKLRITNDYEMNDLPCDHYQRGYMT